MMTYQDEDDDEWEDEDDDFGDDSDEEPTVPCPHCKRWIFEDMPRCPYCEQYISDEDQVGPRKPLWIIAAALVLLGVAIWSVFAVL